MVRLPLAALPALAMALVAAAPVRAGPGDRPALAEADTAATHILAAGQTRRFALRTRPGDTVRGTVAAEAGRFQLDLVDADGRHIRRLADALEGRTAVQFVAPEGPVALALTALETGSARLTAEARALPPERAAPEPDLISPTMAALARRVAAGGDTAAFWAEAARRGTPLVEARDDGQVLLTFLARGVRANARLVGAPSGDHEWLGRLAGSDVWFKSFAVPPETRLAYRIARDVPAIPGDPRARRRALLATAAADPLNRAPWPAEAPDAFNQDSVLELPGAPEQPGLDNPNPPRGTFTRFRLTSRSLGNTRTVTLYAPPGFDPAESRNQLLILFDAQAYLTKVPTPRILDALTAEGRIPPTLAVFVSEIDPDTRARELPGNAAFAAFMARELMPALRARTGVDIPAARTILAGSSYGGLAAATVALAYPAVFGNVVALSGSFWWQPDGSREGLAARVAREPRKPVRFHLAANLFEGSRPDMNDGILETTRQLRDRLRAGGYTVTGREYAGGHDYLVWRGALGDALIALAR
jgi:enterochelin esterase-like enzyme